MSLDIYSPLSFEKRKMKNELQLLKSIFVYFQNYQYIFSRST